MAGKTGGTGVEPVWVNWSKFLVDSELDKIGPLWDLDLSALLQEVSDRLDSIVLIDVLDGGRSRHFTLKIHHLNQGR